MKYIYNEQLNRKISKYTNDLLFKIESYMRQGKGQKESNYQSQPFWHNEAYIILKGVVCFSLSKELQKLDKHTNDYKRKYVVKLLNGNGEYLIGPALEAINNIQKNRTLMSDLKCINEMNDKLDKSDTLNIACALQFVNIGINAIKEKKIYINNIDEIKKEIKKLIKKYGFSDVNEFITYIDNATKEGRA